MSDILQDCSSISLSSSSVDAGTNAAVDRQPMFSNPTWQCTAKDADEVRRVLGDFVHRFMQEEVAWAADELLFLMTTKTTLGDSRCSYLTKRAQSVFMLLQKLASPECQHLRFITNHTLKCLVFDGDDLYVVPSAFKVSSKRSIPKTAQTIRHIASRFSTFGVLTNSPYGAPIVALCNKDAAEQFVVSASGVESTQKRRKTDADEQKDAQLLTDCAGILDEEHKQMLWDSIGNWSNWDDAKFNWEEPFFYDDSDRNADIEFLY